MRLPYLLGLMALAACSDNDRRSEPAQATIIPAPLTVGEQRTVIAREGEADALLRSGPSVPAQLPPDFSAYPGARIISNTVVQRREQIRSLLVMETNAPIDEVMRFYRAQARAAGLEVQVDLGGGDRASLGGHLKGGGDLTISARRAGATTRIELSGTQER